MIKCEYCDDTGSLSEDLYGYLDCVHCEVATERAQLNAWLAADRDMNVDQIDAWTIYSRGKAAALEQAATVCEDEVRPLSEHPDPWDCGYEAAASGLAEEIRKLIKP